MISTKRNSFPDVLFMFWNGSSLQNTDNTSNQQIETSDEA
jgi:hypothetical protein